MTTRYVGQGGSDSNDGSTWTLRKLTIQAAVTLMAAGDITYVGPGIYPETVTVGVSGTSGNECQLIGDISGRYTDGIGGVVKITGSDDGEATVTRNRVILIDGYNYWIIQGFTIGRATDHRVYAAGTASNNTIQDCWFIADSHRPISISTFSDSGLHWRIKRCVFWQGAEALVFSGQTGTGTVDTDNIVESCIFIGGSVSAVYIEHVGGIVFMNCGFIGGLRGLQGYDAPSGIPTQVMNCWFQGMNVGIEATNANDVNQDWNRFSGNINNTNGANVTGGTNSTVGEIGIAPWPLYGDGTMPRFYPFALSPWSALHNAGGDGTYQSTTDLWGVSRPQSLDRNVGPVEGTIFGTRENTTVETGSHAIKISGRGFVDFQVRANSGEQLTINVKVKWDDNTNIGSKPRALLLAAPGFAETATAATGDGSSSWEDLQVQVTPSFTGVVTYRLENRCTYSADIAAYFDTITVTRV